jgi:hypothetical protein
MRGEAKPCMNALSEVGSCMFTWECIKLDGHRLGTCADGFLFGVCCRTKYRYGDSIDAEPVTTLMASTTPSYYSPHLLYPSYPSMSTKSAKFVDEAVSSAPSLNSFSHASEAITTPSYSTETSSQQVSHISSLIY